MKKLISFFPVIIIFLSLQGCSADLYIRENIDYKVPPAKESDIIYRVFLIGDAGEPSPDFREPVLDAMEKRASLLPEKTMNIFLGDNIYPLGLDTLGTEFRVESERRLKEQILVMENSSSAGILIPGNHDWGNGAKTGWAKIKFQEDYINRINNENIRLLPPGGCPGPVYLDPVPQLRIIFIDTNWWLHKNIKPDSSNSDCYPITENEILSVLDSLLKTAEDKFVLIAGHHPFKSYGPHGGHFDWKAHIFPLTELNKYLWIPLPLIGSLYPFARNMGISAQDISNSSYQYMKDKIEDVISRHSGLVYASGHEHALQVIEGINNNLYLISGYGTAVHSNTLSYGDDSYLSARYPGFIQVDLLKDKRVRLGAFIVNPDNNSSEEIFSIWIN